MTSFDPRFSDAWRAYRSDLDLDEYDTRWDRLAAAGQSVHGEADFVMELGPSSVLDAGCGMGRVAIELARRGIAVTGTDLDDDLLDRARRRAPDLEWVRADLAELDLGRTFDVVVMAGNVLPFARPEHRGDIVAALARHVDPAGSLVAGASLVDGWPTVEEYDGWCRSAGLQLVDRFAGWGREPWPDMGRSDYAVVVYRL